MSDSQKEGTTSEAMKDYIGTFMSDTEVNDHQAMREKVTAPIFQNQRATQSKSSHPDSSRGATRSYHRMHAASKAPVPSATISTAVPELVSAFWAGKAAELPARVQKQEPRPDASRSFEAGKAKEPPVPKTQKPKSIFSRIKKVKPKAAAAIPSANPFLIHKEVKEEEDEEERAKARNKDTEKDKLLTSGSAVVPERVHRGPSAAERMKMRLGRSASAKTMLAGHVGKRKRNVTLYSFFQQKIRKQTP